MIRGSVVGGIAAGIWKYWHAGVKSEYVQQEKEKERDREINRDKQRERDRDRERQSDRERQRETVD